MNMLDTVLIKSDDKNATCKMDYYILPTVAFTIILLHLAILLLIMLLFSIIV